MSSFRIICALALLLSGYLPATAADLGGSYVGTSGGDPVRLVLRQQASQLSGTLDDSQQRYAFVAELSGDELQGSATEESLGVAFAVSGRAADGVLDLTLTLEIQGQRAEQSLRLVREGERAAASASAPAAAAPAGASRDPALVGRWVHESQYQSGSGDSYFSGSSTQSMVLLADGRVADGGGSASISGGDYYGTSNGEGGQIAANVQWYTQGQHIWISGSENGQTQTVDLGRYYVEGSNLLITGNNGKRMLFSR